MKRLILVFIFIYGICYGEGEKMKVLFVVNSVSQQIKGFDIETLIKCSLDATKFNYAVEYTTSAGHATQLTKNAVNQDYDIVAAVGGDGTVNEVGKALIGTRGTLAIIPVGSGNGLARHLGISCDIKEAIKSLNHSQMMEIDTGEINGIPFLGVAGIGFDARVAHRFANYGKRGIFSYMQVAQKEYWKYHSQIFTLDVDGRSIHRRAFILTFANGSQYGNNFVIAPKATLQDGYLNLVIIDEIPIYLAPKFLYQVKRGTLSQSRHYEDIPFKELVIDHPYIEAHVDGEPMIFRDVLKVKIKPKSLRVFTPGDLNL